MRNWLVAFTCALSFLAGEEQNFKVNLKDPVFTHGVVTTDQGGIIESENLRIQAQKLEYTNKTENGLAVQKVVAEGNILLEYGGQPFIGSKLEYDFVAKTGRLQDGRTSTDYWFLGGDEIELLADGSFLISNAFLTTVEGQDNWWELRSSQIDVSKKSELTANSIKFRFFKIPVFWLPSFKMNLKWWKDSPVRYKFIWDQVLKQKISMRYELYSTETFGLFGRLQYQFKYGPGAAIETDYHSLDGRTVFQTKNFGAFGKIIPQERGDKRYRLQGIFATHSKNENTHVHMTYDKLSDDKMAQDFKSDDFELDTQKRTIFWVTHYRENFFSRFNFQPRINYFQSINQQLPWATTSIRPFTFGNTGVIMENWFSAGYLDYVFARGINHKFPRTRAGRFETNNIMYRPIPTGPIVWTPSAGVIGIFYTNNQDHHSVGQGIFTYGMDVHTRLFQKFTHVKHVAEPYIRFQGYTNPTANNGQHFIFNLDDGYAHMNSLRAGLRQSFYSVKNPAILPDFSIDMYTYGYVGDTAFHRGVPKAYTQFEIARPSCLIRSTLVYNMQEGVFDRCNVLTNWTVSRDVAMSVEVRHRSRFDWRKADFDNFVMDVERPIEELLHSQLSDRRNTVLTKIHLILSPFWSAHIESHHGWNRIHEPPYNAFELKLRTIITGRWTVELGISYDPAKKWQSISPSFKLMR